MSGSETDGARKIYWATLQRQRNADRIPVCIKTALGSSRSEEMRIPRRKCVFTIVLIAVAVVIFLAIVGHQPTLLVPAGLPTTRGADARQRNAGEVNKIAAVGSSQSQTESPSSICRGKFGYVLILRYSGQQGSGIGALLSQLCWIGSFDLPMRLVEPYIRQSVLVGLPDSLTTSQQLSLGDYFNLNHLSISARDRGYAVVASMDEFLKNAPRNIILVQMAGGIIADHSFDVLWESNTDSVFECMANISTKLTYLEDNGFCVVKVIKVIFGFGTSFVFTAEDMNKKMFGKWKPEDVTLVFGLWRAPWFVENSELVNPAMCSSVASRGLQAILHPSKRMMEDTRRYEDLFLQSVNRLSVMLRIEHSVWLLGRAAQRAANRNKASELSISQCLRQLQVTTRDLQKKLNYDKVFVTADIGKYASTSWNQTFKHFNYTQSQIDVLFNAVKSTVGSLHLNKVSFEQWEESFATVTGGVEDAGYVAALQRTIASRTECLVLVGGGIFQRLALNDYVRNHPNPNNYCVYFVCLDDGYTKEFNDITSGKAITIRV